MIKKHLRGQEAIEFILIIALVFFVAFISVVMFGGKLKAFFEGDSATIEAAQNPTEVMDQATNSKYSPDYITEAPELSGTGTPDNPEMKCNMNVCSIDYGDFSLTGVPEDFNKYIQAAGASGGTELMAKMLKQIADQMEAQEFPAERVEEIRVLANAGHNFGIIEREFEKVAQICGTDWSCMESYQEKPFPALNELDLTYADIYEDSDKDYAHFINLMLVDWWEKCDAGGNVCPNGATHNPPPREKFPIAFKFIDYRNSVINNSELPPSVRGVVDELTWNIKQMASDYHKIFDTDHYDEKDDNLEQYDDYNASSITHFDSALICASGKFTDEGKKCH
jgi:hypothetical protein